MKRPYLFFMFAVLLLLSLGAHFFFGDDRVADGKGAGSDIAVRSEAVDSQEVELPPIVPVVASQGTRISDQFENADDLKEFADKITVSDYLSDPQAAWFLARAYEYCAEYAMNPAQYADQSELLYQLADPQVKENFREARNRMKSRCYRFSQDVDGTLYSREAMIANAITAAKAGSVAAEAWLLAAKVPLSEDPDYVNDLLARVKSSHDPEAYAAIAQAIGFVIPPSALGTKLSVDLAYEAWMIAACRVGRSCGAASSLMTKMCSANSDCLPYPDYETYVANSTLTNVAYQAVRTEVDRIIQ